jgi:hypothetical protein
MLLRPSSKHAGSFEIVGECHVHGIMDGESLLGPLPHGWEVRSEPTAGTREWAPHYWNSSTKILSAQDPRLGKMPPDWESTSQERTPDDPIMCAPHRNKVTGTVLNSDPRLLPEALKDRGVNLETFRLV